MDTNLLNVEDNLNRKIALFQEIKAPIKSHWSHRLHRLFTTDSSFKQKPRKPPSDVCDSPRVFVLSVMSLPLKENFYANSKPLIT